MTPDPQGSRPEDASRPPAPPAGTAGAGGQSPLARLRHLILGTRLTGIHVLIVLLCVGFGFAVVVQVRQGEEDAYASMRQDDLIRLLDELTQRNDELDEEGAQLRQELAELESGSSTRAAAQEAAEQQAQVQGILAGTLAVEGPGIELVVIDPDAAISAPTFVNVLEELRAAGAEAIELDGQRITMSSWITTGADGIVVSGTELTSPYVWRAIGDPHTLAGALGIPGGALASIRGAGGEAEVTQHEDLRITAVRELESPESATPVPADES
ncbi:DUF881 domain-containing protein [Georgenia sunbinii]|uniref:DUF881 domain-containing protein n=1 Tax=Georgenia sunbinii TaxID=3117728 RepID=UPI002F264685